MGEVERGQVDAAAAEVYDALFVPALFGGFATAVAAAADLGPAEDAVDVACGTGALARALRTRTSGRVVGVDINPGMLAVARARGDRIDYRQADAHDLPFGTDEFDVATCQFGLMFLTDPAGGLAEMARVARRGAVAVWDAIHTCEAYLAMRDLFRTELGPEAAASLDAPFAMGRPRVLETLIDAAGVTGASVHSVSGTGRFASVEQWVTTEVRGWTLGDSVDQERLAALVESAHRRLAGFATDDGCAFPISARIATWH